MNGDLNEKETANLDALKALSKVLPVSAWKEPSQSEIEVASRLHIEILNRTDTDIKRYRNRLNELTAR